LQNRLPTRRLIYFNNNKIKGAIDMRLYLSIFSMVSIFFIPFTQGWANQERCCPNCNPPTRCARVDIVCLYEDLSELSAFHNCRLDASFTITVTFDGGEVADRNPVGYPMAFSLRCDNGLTQVFPAQRFTGLLETRIESTNPSQFPAITLPRGSLHTGQHSVSSTLDIISNLKLYSLPGKCFVKTY
jgi:hypothetical protein